MTEPKTQEEFEQKVQELTERLNDEDHYDKDETMELWLEIEEIAYISADNDYGPYYAEVSFTPKDRTDLEEIRTYVFSSTFIRFQNIIHNWNLEGEFEYQCAERYGWTRKALFATSSLKSIKSFFEGKDIKKTVEQVWDGETVYVNSYLLINPRKDVVEWALENKEVLCLSKGDYEIALLYQSIPELRALIEKEVIQ